MPVTYKLRGACIDGELPCYKLQSLIRTGQLKTAGGESIQYQNQLAPLIGVSETQLSHAILERKRMLTPVQSRGGRPRWDLICDATGLAPGFLFPELAFEQPGEHYSGWVSPGETRELLPPPAVSSIELQATAGVWVRFDGAKPSPRNAVGFFLRPFEVLSFRLEKTVNISVGEEDPRANINYRWLR